MFLRFLNLEINKLTFNFNGVYLIIAKTKKPYNNIICVMVYIIDNDFNKNKFVSIIFLM